MRSLGGAFSVGISIGLLAFLATACQLGCTEPATREPAVTRAPAVGPAETMPRLLELRTESCGACRAVAPMVEDLRRRYARQFTVEVVDIAQRPDIGTQYNVSLVPTFIFLDANGRQIDKIVGGSSEQEILNRWRQHGYQF